MAISSRRTIAELTGNGEIYEREKLLGKSKYHLVIMQQMIDAGRDGEVPGMKEVSGHLWDVESSSSSSLVHLEDLVLHLDGGGRMPFLVTDGNGLGGRQEIKPSGAITGVSALDESP